MCILLICAKSSNFFSICQMNSFSVRSLKHKLSNVNLYCISLKGTIDTPSLNERFAATGDKESARKQYEARQKNGRLGKPEEIAALAVYLASDEAAFVTGQKFVIDGGWTM